MGVPEVVGIEKDKEMALKAEAHCQRVLVGDLEAMELDLPNDHFDVILMADVLEHLREPFTLTANLLPFLKRKGSVLISIPNVTHYAILVMMLRGRWEYKARGIMDETHLRFFTRKTFVKEMMSIGLHLVQLQRNCRLVEHDMAFGSRIVKVLEKVVPNEILTFQFLMRFQRVE